MSSLSELETASQILKFSFSMAKERNSPLAIISLCIALSPNPIAHLLLPTVVLYQQSLSPNTSIFKSKVPQ